VAAAGVLLSLLAGVSRTVLAMARRHELPAWYAHVDHRRELPLRAELTVAAVVGILIATVDVRGAIGFSSVTVLTYYALTNASALTLSAQQRRWPRLLAVAGLAGCLALIVSLPLASLVAGAAVLAVGLLTRALLIRRGVVQQPGGTS